MTKLTKWPIRRQIRRVFDDNWRIIFVCFYGEISKIIPYHQISSSVPLPVLPAKTQISLGIRPVWSESSLSAHWVAKIPRFLHADSEDSDQTERMPSLIRVFAWCTDHFVGFVMLWLFLIFWNSLKKNLPTLLFLIGSGKGKQRYF